MDHGCAMLIATSATGGWCVWSSHKARRAKPADRRHPSSRHPTRSLLLPYQCPRVHCHGTCSVGGLAHSVPHQASPPPKTCKPPRAWPNLASGVLIERCHHSGRHQRTSIRHPPGQASSYNNIQHQRPASSVPRPACYALRSTAPRRPPQCRIVRHGRCLGMATQVLIAHTGQRLEVDTAQFSTCEPSACSPRLLPPTC